MQSNSMSCPQHGIGKETYNKDGTCIIKQDKNKTSQGENHFSVDGHKAVLNHFNKTKINKDKQKLTNIDNQNKPTYIKGFLGTISDKGGGRCFLGTINDKINGEGAGVIDFKSQR